MPLKDPFEWIANKPEFPKDGIRIECPRCKKVSIYQRYQLTYRSV